MTDRAIAASRTFAALAAAAFVALAAWAEEDRPTIEPVVKEQVQADDAAVASQERVTALSDETREMLLQYRQYLRETQSLREYGEQLAAQVRSQADEIEFVKRELVEI